MKASDTEIWSRVSAHPGLWCSSMSWDPFWGFPLILHLLRIVWMHLPETWSSPAAILCGTSFTMGIASLSLTQMI